MKRVATLALFAGLASAQSKSDNSVNERIKVRNFCLAIYNQTIDKKASDLTVKQSKAIPACEELGLYREEPTFEEPLEEYKNSANKSVEEIDKEDALRKYLLTLIPAPLKAGTKAKP